MMKILKSLILMGALITVACASSTKTASSKNKPTYTQFRTSQNAEDQLLNENPNCKGACNSGQICANRTNKDAHVESYCMNKPAYAPLDLNFVIPFDGNTRVGCTHSSGSGSHSYSNAYYALDLAADYKLAAPTVRASADGVAFVYGAENGGDCAQPKGTAQNAESSNCGNSWGNHIKILHKDGYFSFYVHLEKALVKTGDVVKQGDPIGVMGWTGAAGHRHLHWSVQKLPGKTQADWISQVNNYAGVSVPIMFRAVQNGEEKTFDSAQVRCAHADLGQASGDDQPWFTGITLRQ